MQVNTLLHNEEISLESDPAFRAYYAGRMAADDPVLGPMVMLVVTKPGATGCKFLENLPFPLADIAKLPIGARR